MKVSWRNPDDDEYDTFEHHHVFVNGEKREGLSAREFIVYLIEKTQAVAVAVNDKHVWECRDSIHPQEFALRAVMGEPREAQAAPTVLIDYTTQDDGVDGECHTCGHLYDTHAQGCMARRTIDNEWMEIATGAKK